MAARADRRLVPPYVKRAAAIPTHARQSRDDDREVGMLSHHCEAELVGGGGGGVVLGASQPCSRASVPWDPTESHEDEERAGRADEVGRDA